MKRISFFSLVLMLASLAACDKQMEEMNTDPLALSKLPDEYLFTTAVRETFGGGGLISSFHMRFASQYAHIYVTNSENRAADSYQDFHTQDIYKEMFSTIFLGPLRYCNEVIQITAEGERKNPVRHAMATILAVLNYAHATDCWGDIPYFNGAWGTRGILYPEYDRQELIYHDMITRLKEAAGVLATASPDQAYPGADPVYGNDLNKWVRFANSMRLRLAMRLRFVSPEYAAPVISDCLSQPLIESNGQNFTLSHQESDNSELYNPWFDIRKYQNFKMSKLLTDWLLETGDPRLYTFVQPNAKGEFKGVLNGLNEQAFSLVDWNSISNPMPALYSKSLPQFLMCASEVWLLRAEAALFGLASGDPAGMYQEGIRMNMLRWAVEPDSITRFLSSAPEATLNGSVENRFRQIATQQWIAFIPNFSEAWTSIRRTGYPIIRQRTDAVVYSLGVTNGYLPKRFRYASNEYLNNFENVNHANSLQGPDKIDTPVWWDTRGD